MYGVLNYYLSSSISMLSSLVILGIFLMIFGLDMSFDSVVSQKLFLSMFICINFPFSLMVCGRFYWWVRVMRYTVMSMIFKVGEHLKILRLT